MVLEEQSSDYVTLDKVSFVKVLYNQFRVKEQ